MRNDALTVAEAMATGAQAFLLSPGPCTPNEAGISLDLVAACADAGSRCSAFASATSRSASILAARSCAAA